MQVVDTKNKRLLDEVNEVLANISVAVAAERSTFFLFNKERDTLESVIAQGVEHIILSVPVGMGMVGRMFQNEKPLIVNNAQESDLFDKTYDKQLQYVTRSAICVPVYNDQGELVGALQSLNQLDDNFQERDLIILNSFAAAITIILKNKALFHASEQIKNNFSTLLEVFAAVSSELDLDTLIQLIMEKAAAITQADRSSLFFRDQETGELWTIYAKGLEKMRVRTKKGLVAEVAKNRKASIVNDPYANAFFDPSIDAKTGYKTQSILSVPVFDAKNTILGVIQVVNKKTGAFDAKDLAILNGFASQISIAVENARLFEQIYSIKNYLDVLVQNLDTGIVTVDKSGVIKTVNKVFYRMLGFSKSKDIVGHTIDSLDTCLRPLFDLTNQTLFSGKKHYEGELLIDCNEKNTALTVSVLPMIAVNGELIGSINVFQDISKEKRIQTNLSRYIPHHLVTEVINKDDLSMLQGRYGKCSTLFCDIRNFTSLTEELGAIQIVELLNTYFGAMLGEVYAHHGILDKFIGDALMAVFGIPYANNLDACNAVKCALSILQLLEELNQKANKQPMVTIGIGISTGDVVSGNIGSEKRFEYTVIGDPVNLASRLETATKEYEVNLLICEHTYQSIKSYFHCREIDTLHVKGKQKPVKIYTVSKSKEYILSKKELEFNTLFANGLEAYRAESIIKAQENFKLAQKLNPKDGPTNLMLQRCLNIIN